MKSVKKGAEADAFHLRQVDKGKRGAGGESIVVHFRDGTDVVVSASRFGQCINVTDAGVPETAGDVFQRFASGKGILADPLHVGGQEDGLQFGAVGKQIVEILSVCILVAAAAKPRDAGKIDGNKTVASDESAVSQYFEGSGEGENVGIVGAGEGGGAAVGVIAAESADADLHDLGEGNMAERRAIGKGIVADLRDGGKNGRLQRLTTV